MACAATDITWGQIWRAIDDGLYPDALGRDLGITRDGGFGGGWPPLSDPTTLFLVEVVREALIAITTGAALSQWVRYRARQAIKRAPRRHRRLAQDWAEHGLLESNTLLDYIFQRPRWTPPLLKARLDLPEEVDAIALLRLCGWQPDADNTWTPTSYKTAGDCALALHHAENQLTGDDDEFNGYL